MCDLAFINLLREKVRHQEEENRRSAAFGKSSRERFVPWTMPVKSSLQAPSESVAIARPVE
jgi:hypothetical protein